MLLSQPMMKHKHEPKLYAEVRANESRLTQFLEAMPVGVTILDANGKPCYANLVAQQLLGESIVLSATTEQLSEVYQFYRAGTNQSYPKEQMPIVRALQGDRSAVDDIEIHQGVKIIPIESGEHLLALINQVLDLSKIEAGQMRLKEANFDLYRLLNDLENMFQHEA
jgi:signal transduction histidine kinase